MDADQRAGLLRERSGLWAWRYAAVLEAEKAQRFPSAAVRPNTRAGQYDWTTAQSNAAKSSPRLTAARTAEEPTADAVRGWSTRFPGLRTSGAFRASGQDVGTVRRVPGRRRGTRNWRVVRAEPVCV